MSEIVGTPDSKAVEGTAAVHKAYSFACLNCGYGWEQDYEVEQRPDREGRIEFHYRANGVPVPSPLAKPNCPGCSGTHVRIFRAGRVADAASAWYSATHARESAPAPDPAPTHTPEHGPARPRKERRLHLPFHFRLRRRHTTPEP